LKILVVDDAPALAQLLAAYFESVGHEVVTLDSGVAVEETIRVTAFDVVFTDVAMPGVSGWQVLELVRAARPGVPVVLMTGWDAERPAESDTARPDAIVEKPFKLDQIRKVLDAVTRGGRR
jgi:DNA-binding response OmpR family regulator